MRSAAPAALLALVACGSAAVPPASPSAIEITVSAQEGAPAPPAIAEPPPPAGPSVDAITLPVAVGCAVAGSRVLTRPLPLCLALEGPCFASGAPRAAAARITVTFPEGDVLRSGALVELDDGHVVVRGWTRAAAVPLSPRMLFTLGTPRASADFLAPVGDVLEIESAAHGTAGVALRLGPGVIVEGGVARAQRRCNELQLDPRHVGTATVARFVAGKPPPAVVKTEDVIPVGKDTPLSSVPGEPRIAVLHPDDELDAEVEIFERRGREARIFWSRDGYAVFGWIPAAALHKRPLGGVMGGLAGAVSGGASSAPTAGAVVCDADVPLLVEVLGRTIEVGRVRKGTPLRVIGRRAGYAVVELRDPVAVLENGAAWALRETDLAKECATR